MYVEGIFKLFIGKSNLKVKFNDKKYILSATGMYL